MNGVTRLPQRWYIHREHPRTPTRGRFPVSRSRQPQRRLLCFLKPNRSRCDADARTGTRARVLKRRRCQHCRRTPKTKVRHRRRSLGNSASPDGLLVGAIGFEPMTPSASRKCSPPELSAHAICGCRRSDAYCTSQHGLRQTSLWVRVGTSTTLAQPIPRC